ncbi:MAG: DUF3576 domain-containing protein [Proteobacteria bacterium]|nr:DUF3576 domain-containing protein [Pseudomonadota bacterium]
MTLAMLSGCSGPIVKEASYPTRQSGTDKILYSDQKRETIWGDGESLGSKLFGKDDEKNGGGAGIGVNSFLWRASLDTIAFMPVASADPFGGVILTDWYENPNAEGERFKINVYILDKQLRADGLRVSVFKQKKDKTAWRDVAVADGMATTIENTILTRARDLRVAQLGTKKTN